VEFNPLLKEQVNPLSKFMRQPKIYIRLPSNGNFWPEGSLVVSENGEYPVYSMTAKDELLLKIPDALMNGQAVVDVIQNCIPNIKNAWHTPSIDVDAILIAIRMATYGEKMKVPFSLNENFDMEYQADLRIVMDKLLETISWDPVVPISDEMTIFVKPINYKQMTKSALQTFETQKIMQVANDDTINEEDKIQAFKNSFSKLTEVTIDMVGSSIFKIDTSNGSTDNERFIREFVSNMDNDIFNKVQTHLDKLKEQNSVKSITVTVTDEMRAQGVTGETIEIPLVFDASTFFV
jgi:hypothetical protein